MSNVALAMNGGGPVFSTLAGLRASWLLGDCSKSPGPYIVPEESKPVSCFGLSHFWALLELREALQNIRNRIDHPLPGISLCSKSALLCSQYHKIKNFFKLYFRSIYFHILPLPFSCFKKNLKNNYNCRLKQLNFKLITIKSFGEKRTTTKKVSKNKLDFQMRFLET